MANQRMKRMTKGNTKGFFTGMRQGERFTSYFGFEVTYNKAAKAGYAIAIDPVDQDQFLISYAPNVVETPDVRSSNVYPVLRANNTNVFFSDKKVGDEFAFISYTFEQVQKIAELNGFEIEQCERFKNGEILRIKSIIKSEPQPQPVKPAVEEPSLKDSYGVSEAALAISAMLAVRMGCGSIESRGAYMIKHALLGTMFYEISAAHNATTEEEFIRSFGMPYPQLRRLAHVIDNIQADHEGLMAAGLIASFTGGLIQNNYALLAKAGIPKLMHEWNEPAAGAIKRVDTMKLSDRTIAIVTVRTREEEDWFAPADNSSIRFAKYEDALLYCLFGEHHFATVGTIYRAIGH